MADKKPVSKKKKPNQVWKLYDKGKAKNVSCPKCGPGYFMAKKGQDKLRQVRIC